MERFSPFSKWGNWNKGKLNNLREVTRLAALGRSVPKPRQHPRSLKPATLHLCPAWPWSWVPGVLEPLVSKHKNHEGRPHFSAQYTQTFFSISLFVKIIPSDYFFNSKYTKISQSAGKKLFMWMKLWTFPAGGVNFQKVIIQRVMLCDSSINWDKMCICAGVGNQRPFVVEDIFPNNRHVVGFNWPTYTHIHSTWIYICNSTSTIFLWIVFLISTAG